MSFFCTEPPTTEIYTLSLHDALPISGAGPSGSRRGGAGGGPARCPSRGDHGPGRCRQDAERASGGGAGADRKSTRLNSSHRCISYAVFCLKKKKKQLKVASAADS